MPDQSDIAVDFGGSFLAAGGGPPGIVVRNCGSCAHFIPYPEPTRLPGRGQAEGRCALKPLDAGRLHRSRENSCDAWTEAASETNGRPPIPVTDDFREKYTAARKAVYDIEAERRRLLAPTDAAHAAALDRLTELEGDLPDEVCKCGNCGALIFPGDPRWYDDDLGDVCVNCAPTYADLQRDHQGFTWGGDEMSREKADEIVREHLECGGSLTDSMAL